MKRVLRRVLLLLTLLALIGVGSAGAAVGATGTTGTVVSPGLNTTGGTATAADGSTRTLSSTESASMMQPMLAAMYYGTPQFVAAPPSGQRSTITFDWVFTAEPPQITGTVTVNYVQQGATGWMSFPAQALWPGSAVTADLADKWFVASPAFVQAFNGQGTVQTFPPDDSSGGGSGSSSINGPLIVGVIIAAVGLLAGSYAVTRRRRARR